MIKLSLLLFGVLVFGHAAVAAPPEPFRFEAHPDVSDMQAYIRQTFPIGTNRMVVRRAFVGEGGATLVPRPNMPDIEKYVYDIDLCHYYLFRWNISVDYDRNGLTKQFYVEGEPIYPDAEDSFHRKHPDPNLKANVLKLARLRSDAYKGDDHVYALVMDWNPANPTSDDKDAFVGGPTRAGFPEMGQVHVYHSELWRSIVDDSTTKTTAEYPADCKAIDAQANGQRPPNVSLLILNKLLQAGQRAIGVPPQNP